MVLRDRVRPGVIYCVSASIRYSFGFYFRVTLYIIIFLYFQGVKSAFVNLEKIVQQHFDAKNLDQRFYDYLSQRLAEVINSLDANCVPVVTGFLGPVPGSLVSSIGRGYTDLTAALVAVGTGAKELQIWKEVDGTICCFGFCFVISVFFCFFFFVFFLMSHSFYYFV